MYQSTRIKTSILFNVYLTFWRLLRHLWSTWYESWILGEIITLYIGNFFLLSILSYVWLFLFSYSGCYYCIVPPNLYFSKYIPKKISRHALKTQCDIYRMATLHKKVSLQLICYRLSTLVDCRKGVFFVFAILIFWTSIIY